MSDPQNPGSGSGTPGGSARPGTPQPASAAVQPHPAAPQLGAVPRRPSGSAAAIARPPTGSGQAPALGAGPRPRTSPGGVINAARMQPIATRPEPPKDIKQRLKVEAENAALNAVGALTDAAKAFNRSSKYFKYRVFIVGAFAFLAASTFWAACPSNPLAPQNDLGAVLVVAGEASRPVYMVKNESTEAWKNVVLVANKKFRAMSPRIDAGGNFTITPKQLIGDNGNLAAPDMKIVDLEIRTDDGSNILLKNGEPP